MDLLSSSSSSAGSDSENDDEKFVINEHYAKAFQYHKEREELDRLQQEDLSSSDSDDSEDDEEEDEDGEELTPTMDAAILRTLSLIRAKNPEIYNPSSSILSDEQRKLQALQPRAPSTTKKKGDEKKITFRQHVLHPSLHAAEPEPEPEEETHVEKQKKLREETIAAFHGPEDDEDDELFVVRPQEEEGEEEYKQFLEKSVGGVDEIRQLINGDGIVHSPPSPIPSDERKKNRQKEKGKRNDDADQDFLLNYILNRGWIDKSQDRVPTYHEITKDEKEEEFEEIVDLFESSYNFRFEEPDAAHLKTYPRTDLPELVRRDTNATRKEARARKKERKALLLQKAKEERRKERNELMKKLEKEGGVKFNEESKVLEEWDEEWDEEKHEKQMQALMDQQQEDGEKPTWDDDDDFEGYEVDDGEGYTYIEQEQEPTKKSKKKKKKSDEAEYEEDGAEWIDNDDNEEKRKVEEYMDTKEFNDIVGNLPTRFKYTSVAPQSYALTPVEILLATDAELNEYMGIKKYAPYRKTQWENRRDEKLKEFKSKLKDRLKDFGGSTSFTGNDREGESGKRKGKKRKGKKERMKEQSGPAETTTKRKREDVAGPSTKRVRT